MRTVFSPVALLCLAGSLPAQDKVEFNRDVRPILSDACFACHGPDKNKRKAKLRLDDRAVAVEMGAIIPGKASESELVRRILSADADTVMPPPASHKTLTVKQKETLKKWIEQGAEYQPHWAYLPIANPAVPAVKGTVGNPIDAFVLAELEKRGIAPSPTADRRTLIRRVTLDLTGLPPTPAEVEAFLTDTSPTAWEKVVDRLLASPHYGERMATPWLDLVRFADTVGYHGDQNQRIFPYRDWVIDAFNRNLGFDHFTRQQLAGDLLPPGSTSEALVASGFNRLNMMTREGGAQPKEYIAKYQADRVRTVSMAWLGSTMGCAECHDHKYDPFSTKDFYSMSAFFADVRQWGVYNDYNYTPNPDLKGWSNDHPFPPEIEVDSLYLKKRIGDLRAKLVAAAGDPKDRSDAAKAWVDEVREFVRRHNSVAFHTPVPDAGKDATVGAGGRVVFLGKAAKGETRTLTLTPEAGTVASVRLELLPDAAHGGKITRDAAAATTVQLSLVRKAKDGGETKVPLFFGDADRSDIKRYSNTVPELGLLNGWTTAAGQADKPHTAVWLLDAPIRIADGDRLVVTLKSDNVGCVRVSVSPLVFTSLTTAVIPSWASPRNVDPSPAALAEAYSLFPFADNENGQARAAVKPILKEIYSLRGGRAWTQVTARQDPIPIHVLPRGNWMDESGPVVPPAVPAFLPGIENRENRRLTRLDLADWIVAKDNPLTARVFVNRLWKQFFGTGLSAVMEDVGAQGEPPSHPELLDWLATTFRDGAVMNVRPLFNDRSTLGYSSPPWDVKAAVKLVVTSRTYCQASKARPELKDLDPNNRLVAYMSPRRLEAEFVRDGALSAAGLLNREIGGPSAFPYQPAGYYANIQFPDRNYVASPDDRQYRRGIYVHWQRTFLHPMLANFDAPSREECTASRPTANTPQQALTLLNDPTFAEASRVMAAGVLTGDIHSTDAKRLERVFQLVLARGPKPAEQEALTAFLANQREYFKARSDDARKRVRVGNTPATTGKDLDPVEHAAWAELCRVVLNLHEAITRY